MQILPFDIEFSVTHKELDFTHLLVRFSEAKFLSSWNALLGVYNLYKLFSILKARFDFKHDSLKTKKKKYNTPFLKISLMFRLFNLQFFPSLKVNSYFIFLLHGTKSIFKISLTGAPKTDTKRSVLIWLVQINIISKDFISPSFGKSSRCDEG